MKRVLKYMSIACLCVPMILSAGPKGKQDKHGKGHDKKKDKEHCGRSCEQCWVVSLADADHAQLALFAEGVDPLMAIEVPAGIELPLNFFLDGEVLELVEHGEWNPSVRVKETLYLRVCRGKLFLSRDLHKWRPWRRAFAGNMFFEVDVDGDAPALSIGMDVEFRGRRGGDCDEEEVEDPTVEEPAPEEPVPEEPVAEEPAPEVPVVEEPVAEEPAPEEPVAEEPVPEEPVAEEPAPEVPVVEEPVAEEPAPEEPVAEQPVPEEPVAEEPVPEVPVVAEPVAEEPAPEEPVAEEPVPEEPVAEEPAPEVPVVEEPVAEEPTPEEPVAEEIAPEVVIPEQETVVEQPESDVIASESDDVDGSAA